MPTNPINITLCATFDETTKQNSSEYLDDFINQYDILLNLNLNNFLYNDIIVYRGEINERSRTYYRNIGGF
jgi:hypothetical protein